MILKILGSLLVLAASTLIGQILSRDCVRRPRELRELQGLLQMFENEISFLANPLREAFNNICRAGTSEAANIFRLTVKNLEAGRSMNASEAWEAAVRNTAVKASLNKEDEEILVSFGKLLGSSDVEGQIKNIRLTLSQLRLQEQKAEEDKVKNETMFKRLGILGGLAIVIVLF